MGFIILQSELAYGGKIQNDNSGAAVPAGVGGRWRET